MSVEEDVMKIQKKLTKMTSDDGTVGVVIDTFKEPIIILACPQNAT